MLKASTGQHRHVVRHENRLTKPRSPPPPETMCKGVVRFSWVFTLEHFYCILFCVWPISSFWFHLNESQSFFPGMHVALERNFIHWLADSLHAHAAYRHKITMVWLRNRLKPSNISLTHPKNRPCRFSPPLNKLPLNIIWVQPVA